MELLSSPTPRFSPAPQTFAGVRSPKKTIFLVQNGTHLTNPICSALQENGYEVVHATSVEAGLQLWSELTQTIDLFVADMGLQKHAEVRRLVQVLQAENPRMRVLFVNDLEAIEGTSSMQLYPKQLVNVVQNCLA
jgi:ActR/RegA family two-component response regulator